MSETSPSKTFGPNTSGLRPAQKCTVLTLLFVDIDGVVNVGIGDKGAGALSCNTENIAYAENMGKDELLRCKTAQMLKLVARQTAEQETCTYGQLCKGSKQLAEVYIRRLAEIIAAAKTQGGLICVLASTWRTKNVQGVRVLEEAISRHLKEPFAFDANTGSKECAGPTGRLGNIGKFLTDWAQASAEILEGSVRVLVLEDFHITPLNGWKCNGKSISSTLDVEEYLRQCLPQDLDVSLRHIHPFHQWTDSSNQMVLQVGCGLAKKHFHKALDFLGYDVDALAALEVPRVSGAPLHSSDVPLLSEDPAFSRGFRGGWEGEGFVSL